VGNQVNEDTIPKDKRTKANAAGSMETTIADYTRFVAAVLNRNGLSDKSWNEMLAPQIPIYSKWQFPSLDTTTTTDNERIGLSYGLGWGIFTSPSGKVFFKEGHGDGWEHYALCFPERKAAVIIMTNSSNGESIFKELFKDLAGITIPWEWERYIPYRGTVQLSPDILQQYSGNYVGKFNVYFKVENGRLVAQSPDAELPPTILYASSDHHFFLKTMDADIDFVRGPDGKVNKAAVNDEGEQYDLDKVKDTALSTELLGLYQGTFKANLERSIVVTLKRGRLFAEGTNPKDHLPKLELRPYSINAFYLKDATLKFRFESDGQAHITKLVTFGSPAGIAEWPKVE
jgi:hypothetical protein